MLKNPVCSLPSVSCQTVDITLHPPTRGMDEQALFGPSKLWKRGKYVMANTEVVPSQEAGDIELERRSWVRLGRQRGINMYQVHYLPNKGKHPHSWFWWLRRSDKARTVTKPLPQSSPEACLYLRPRIGNSKWNWLECTVHMGGSLYLVYLFPYQELAGEFLIFWEVETLITWLCMGMYIPSIHGKDGLDSNKRKRWLQWHRDRGLCGQLEPACFLSQMPQEHALLFFLFYS